MQTLYFQSTGHLSIPSLQINCVSTVFVLAFCASETLVPSAVNKNIMGFDLQHCSI